jgi:hypothetical protein
MLYIYRQKGSTGARDLAEGIMLYRGENGDRGVPTRRTKGEALRRLQAGDAIICWGDHFAAAGNVKTLNNIPPIGKFEEAQKLKAAGINTVEVSRTKPAPRVVAKPAFVPAEKRFGGGLFTGQKAAELVAQLQEFILEEQQRKRAYDAAPAPVAGNDEWLARRNNHVGGRDLLARPGDIEPQYYSKKLDLVEEYRLHMFRGKSIRAGKKSQNPTRPDGSPAHPWIRSYDAGWVIKYDGFKSTKEMRALGAAALKALGLDFGAVDMGKTRDGKLVVLEVNRAPGVEGGTVDAYAKHIIAWAKGQDAAGDE